MNLFKNSTLVLALALTNLAACSSSSNNNTDVPNIGTGGTIATGGVTGTGGAGGSIGFDAAVGTGGAVADAGTADSPASVGPPDAGIDGPALGAADALGGEVGNPTDICTNLTPQQCHLAIINATPDSTVSALDPGANPPVLYPTCSAQ